MTITGSDFIYAGQSTDQFGTFKCDIESINTESNDESTDLIMSTTPSRNTWSLHAVQKAEPLKFKVTICLASGEFIDAFTERQLKKWLCKDGFNWLSFNQDDLFNCYFYCIFSNPQKVNVGRMSGGLEFQVTCNSGNAWSELKTKKYDSTENSTFNFYNETDYDNYILSPTLTIVPCADGNISIANTTTGQSITLNNCVVNEEIILDCENEMISTSSTRNIIDDWNVTFLSMKEGSNQISLTGNFKLQFDYRLPIRIGG
jgi:hypothetical protein